MTIQEQFDKYLADHINLTKEDVKKVQVHIELREQLETKLEFKGKDNDETYSFLTGSYSRNTAIRPPKDVDFFIVLNDEKYGDLKPSELLNLLEKTLKEILPDKTVFQQTHSVTIEYDEEFSIDVIPAFEINSELYKIPHVSDNSDLWLESNPKIHGEKLTEANNAANKLLVPLVKLLKSWKRDKCSYVKSFHLELLTIEIINNFEFESYSKGINLFFDNAKDYLDSAIIVDPANSDNLVDDYLTDDERGNLKFLINTEATIARSAVDLEDNGKTDEAIKEWNKIFTFNPQKKESLTSKQSHEKVLPYAENLQYDIKITSKLFNPTLGKYKENYYSNSRKLPKGWKLRFYVDTSSIPDPKKVFWQVVNTGQEAERAGDLRGEVLDDQGSNRRDEHTKYKGTHYVNCFVVKNNSCIAKSRFFVSIK
ncbi:MAG: nucleotidyltransferase [Candidatus Pacebacteria bacterium]|nr:nucleotidyltransferase [Candidatus Paceibacterota bacterium]